MPLLANSRSPLPLASAPSHCAWARRSAIAMWTPSGSVPGQPEARGERPVLSRRPPDGRAAAPPRATRFPAPSPPGCRAGPALRPRPMAAPCPELASRAARVASGRFPLAQEGGPDAVGEDALARLRAGREAAGLRAAGGVGQLEAHHAVRQAPD